MPKKIQWAVVAYTQNKGGKMQDVDEARRLLDDEKKQRAKRAYEIIRAVLDKEQCELHFIQNFVNGHQVNAQWAVIPKQNSAEQSKE